MPPKAMDFSKTQIYKIACKDLTVKDIYVGSTTNVVKRRAAHKKDCTNENGKTYNLRVYRFIREHGGFENWDVVVVEQFPCENDEIKRTRERHWCEQLGATLNSIRPIITEQETRDYQKVYYTDNAAEIKDRMKIYNVDNASKIKDRSKIYRAEHAAEINEKQKNYAAEHTTEIKDYKKIYYTENAAEIKTQKAERITCLCGVEHARGDKARHQRTAKHIAAMAAL